MSMISLGSIVIIGDSLSVTVVKGRPVTTPGGQLAFLLAAAGHEVHLEAIGGFALQYFRGAAAETKKGQEAAGILRRARAKNPKTVLVLLGTNDYADSPKALQAGIAAIVDAFSLPGASPNLLFVGPPSFSVTVKGGALKTGTALVYEALARSRRPVLDTRPLSSDIIAPAQGRSDDGIHFKKSGAVKYAQRIFQVLKGREAIKRSGRTGNIIEKVSLVIAVDAILGGPISRVIEGLFSGKKGRQP